MCCRKFLVSKNVKDKRERGASRLSIENLLSHNTEKFRRGNLCFRKVLVSQSFMDEKGSFPSEISEIFGFQTFHRNFFSEKFVECRKIS